MRRRIVEKACIALLVLASGAGAAALFQGAPPKKNPPGWTNGLPKQHKSKWYVHDYERPRPPKVEPGAQPGDPPSDAVVLFDGKDASKWSSGGGPAKWKVEGGYMEMVKSGSISTKEKFGDCQLHIEWQAPSPTRSEDQGRGNSGIFLMNRYEVQVLDSYDNDTYPDGSAGAIYGQQPPLFNACRPPGQWQTYDIIFRAPRFKDGNVSEPARMTIFHNGVVVQHNAEVFGETIYRNLAKYSPHEPEAPITLQDHGDDQPVRFRNIWARRLNLSENATE